MRSNALNREVLERQKLARRGGCRLQFSNVHATGVPLQ